MDCASNTVFRCRACTTLFEGGVADSGPGGAPRCLQCGLSDATPVVATDNDFVVRKGTKFR